MPFGNQIETTLLHQLIYGEPKTRKTWWTLKAAEFNYNLLVLSGSATGTRVIANIDPAARHRVRIINCNDKPVYPVFGEFVTRFLRGMNVVWDDTAEQFYFENHPTIKYDPTHGYFQINSTLLTQNDVLIIDNWTELSESVIWNWMLENGVDIASGKRPENIRDMFGYASAILSWMLATINHLPCHTMVICHKQTVDVMKKVPTEKKDRMGRPVHGEEPTGEQHIVPVSSSRAHSEKLAAKFDDILDFQKQGNQVYIDTTTSEGREGGSRTVHGRFPWEKLTIVDFLKPLGLQPPQQEMEMPGCVYFPPNIQTQEQAAVDVTPMNDPLDADKASQTDMTLAAIGGMGKRAAE